MQTLLTLFFLFSSMVHGWTITSRPSSVSTQLSARRGKGIGGVPSSRGGGSPVAAPSAPAGSQWWSTGLKTSELPTTDNTVKVLETNLFQLKNSQTNPNGAVATIRYNDTTYCFAINCACCKVPLLKSTVTSVADRPVLVCDLCKSSYDLSTGAKLAESAATSTGFFGSIAKGVFARSSENGPLQIYSLGEKDGNIMILLKD